MSRNHLIVEGLASSFRLRDVGSSNGTFVNDSRISTVELCPGDHITAGTSVFRVDFEATPDERVGRGVEPPDRIVDPVIPTRMLSGDFLNLDDEMTQRIQLAEADAAAPSGMETYQTPSEDEFPPGGEPRQTVSGGTVREGLVGDGAPAQSSAAERGMSGNWLSAFQSGGDRCLARQSQPAALAETKRIVEQLQRDTGRWKFTVVVNRCQLDSRGNGMLDFAESTGESSPLTETLSLLHCSKPDVALEFFKSCLGMDAAILVASTEPLSRAWFQNALDALSYPSLLFDVLSQSAERAGHMAKHVHFMLFEPNSGGELCLLYDPNRLNVG